MANNLKPHEGVSKLFIAYVEYDFDITIFDSLQEKSEINRIALYNAQILSLISNRKDAHASTRLLQGDVGRGIGLEGEAGSDEEDGGRIRIRAKGKSSPADRAARAGGRERAAAGGSARERVPFRLVAN